MASIKLTGDTSGEITISAPAVAGTNTLTLPAHTGTVMVDGPAFSAYASADQSLSAGVHTKVAFDTELFDTNSNYDTSNYRFTPTVKGYYQVNITLRTTGSALNTRVASIYKNGVQDLAPIISRDGSPTAVVFSSSNLIYMNGTTDYLEIYALLNFSSGTGIIDFFTTSNTSFFQAHLARSA